MQSHPLALDPGHLAPVTRYPARRGVSSLRVARPGPSLALGTRLLKQSRCGSFDRWHCAQAEPGQVAQAYQGLAEQGFDVFVPLYRAQPQAQTLTPLFGSYLFLAFDPAELTWLRVRSTKGVVKLFMAGDRPNPLRPGVVEELIDRTLNPPAPPALSAGPQPGDRVRARVGGKVFEGVCELTTKQRVHLLFECFGGYRSVNVPRASVTILS